MLEPSPPAVRDDLWFADDPVARGEPPEGRAVVSPVPTGDVLWDELARDDDELAAWCAERWLGAYRPLEPAPPTLVTTRTALHRVAERVISPVRARDNGKIGLRWTLGGFGTPFFGADAQIRVDGGQLVIDAAGEERRHPLDSIAGAAAAIGFDLSGAREAEDDAELDVDPAAARFLGDVYGFATSVLEELRAGAPPAAEASRVQLWPEHFDVAVEIGAESSDERAAYGVSPGDESHPEPYLYVAPWAPSDRLPYAELQHADLIREQDQRAAALDFFTARLA